MQPFRNIDSLLKPILVQEGVDVIKYNKLTESDKNEISKDLVARVYKSIKDKTLQIDYSFIEKSKGDITKIQNYADLEGSINYLQNMYNNDTNAPKEINDLKKTLNNLKRYTRDFTTGYKKKNELVMFYYNNVVASLISATSFIIATSVDYIKDTMKDMRPVFKANLSKNKSANLFLENIRSFNSMVTKGHFKTFVDNANNVDNLVGLGLTAFLAIAIAIFCIRDAVYIFFYSRNSVSENLLNLAYFVNLNANAASQKNGKAKGKQEKIAKQLINLSDKISVEQKVSTKKAEHDMKIEENDTDAYVASDDDLL